MTADQFMAWPGDGTGRGYELVDGELRAMAPPSDIHGRLQARIATGLNNQLRAKRSVCEAVTGAGVQPRPGMLYNVRVPDVLVTCSPATGFYVELPVIIVEILSPSNTRETREAIRAMLSIPSLREVLTLGSESVKAEILTRGPDGHWPAEPTVRGPGERVVLDSLGVTLGLDTLYDGLGLR